MENQEASESNPESEYPERVEDAVTKAINSSKTGERVVKEKVSINPNMSPDEIMRTFNVSRATAFRAKERGHVNVNYRQRVIDPDRDWNNQNGELVLESARKGATSALHKLAASCGKRIDEFLAPYALEDAIEEGVARIMELSNLPERDQEGWRVKVAKIAAYAFVQRMVKKARWQRFDIDKLESMARTIEDETQNQETEE